MSRDVRTPSPTPHAQSQSQSQGAGGGGAPGGAPQGGSSFFLKERERLVGEIAESLGQIMNHSNALNRKLEESILVGKEFEPVAALWGRFASQMSATGVPEPGMEPAEGEVQHEGGQQQQEEEAAEGEGHAEEGGRRSASGRRGAGGDEVGFAPGTSSGRVAGTTTPGGAPPAGGDAGMPPGVAPGGGNWTATPGPGGAY